MELRRYLNLLRKRSWLVVLAVLAGLVGGYLITPDGPTYRATSTIYVGAREFRIEPGFGDLSNDRVSAIERLLLTFATMARSDPIAQEAIARTGVPRSAPAVVGATQAVPLIGTQLLSITVTDRDPAIAQALANGIAESFVQQVQSFEPGAAATEGSLPALPAYLFERARLPVAPLSTNLRRNLLVNGMFGFLAAVALVVLLEYVDITIRTADDVESRVGLPVLASIPNDRDTVQKPMVLAGPSPPPLPELSERA